MPGFEDASAEGAVSAGHVDAIACATRNLDDTEAAEFAAEADSLLADAERQGVDAFGRTCRDLATSIRARHNAQADVDELEAQRAQSKISRWVDTATGMHKTLIEADPLTDRIIWSAIQRERGKLRRHNQQHGDRVSWDRLTVDALVDAVTTPAGGDRRGTIVAHIDLESLTVEQRIALEAMQATCSHPDCTVPIDDCRIHHLTPWATGGTTDLAHLAPVCEPHHHLVHEGGSTLTITPRPHRHLDPPRRHHPLDRPHRRPTAGSHRRRLIENGRVQRIACQWPRARSWAPC